MGEHVGKKVQAFHTLPLQMVPDPLSMYHVQIEELLRILGSYELQSDPPDTFCGHSHGIGKLGFYGVLAQLKETQGVIFQYFPA